MSAILELFAWVGVFAVVLAIGAPLAWMLERLDRH